MTCRLHVPPETLVAGEVVVRGDDHHYLFRVRRLRPGDPVVVFDGAGMQAEATVATICGEDAVLRLDPPRTVPPPTPAIRMLLPLLKGDAFDSCVSKLVELGVTGIAPIHTRRCVVRVPANKAPARRQRFVLRAQQAARQSRNPYVAEIEPIADLAQALAATGEMLRLVCWEGETRSLRDALPACPPPSVAVLFGPEGGLEPEEVEAATAAGFEPVSLGPRILRAETAPVAVAAILRFEYGDVG